MSFDTFKAEQKTIDRAQAALDNPDKVDLEAEFRELLVAYAKLLKVTGRIVRMSDRSEERLKVANVTIVRQQQELEKAHGQLSEHAQLLENKVRDRTKELVAAQSKLEQLVHLGIALSVERQHSKFMEMIVEAQKHLTNADGGILFSRDGDALKYETLRFDTLDLRLGGLSGNQIDYPSIPLRDAQGKPNYFNPVAQAVLTERTINVHNIKECKDFDFADIMQFDEQQAYHSQSFLAVPLKPRKGEVLGVLVLINARASGTGRVISFDDEAEKFIEALASQAAVAVDNKNLLEAQNALLDSIIQVIASAIDAKSPYTGGHCARVPVLGKLLARAACESNDEAFSAFNMTEDQWREFHLAGWLHDCGKVTTPEYVVDKATKLETVYNRIHEVRMRFEVLLRDRRIAYQEALLRGEDPEKCRLALQEAEQALFDDFAFVAECNIGGEFMDQAKIDRLMQIATQTWMRHFDDQLGLSWVELHRKDSMYTQLPVKEYVLADKKEHLVKRDKDSSVLSIMEQYGISMTIPQYQYNHGELYNLCIKRGTLNDEERYKINDHVIQSLIMLNKLPFPTHLSRVPEIASAHHETIEGTGYPRKLSGEDMSVQAKILAIADIFDALTASDRPYKKAKTLSESLKIMSFMRNDKHIDAKLFDLFLTSGVFSEFAEKYLKPEQIDSLEIQSFLSR